MLFLDYLYSINAKLKSDNSIWEKLQIKRFARVCIKLTTNILLPVVFRITKQNTDCIKEPTLPLVVSLTSFPNRISRVWMTIESMLRQTSKPHHIILWLSREQFPREELDLPKSLIAQTKRGLVIRFVDGDARSHKKYYYAFKEYTEYSVVTIDDDLLFPSTFLKRIYECSLHHPNDVIASFGSKFYWDDVKQCIIEIPRSTKVGESGNELFFGSGAGTLFKPKFLIEKLDSLNKIMELCPTADDVYLNALIRICGFGVTFHLNNPLLSIFNSKDVKLYTHNGDYDDVESPNAKQVQGLIKYLKGNPFYL